jgi:hypothetical protein
MHDLFRGNALIIAHSARIPFPHFSRVLFEQVIGDWLAVAVQFHPELDRPAARQVPVIFQGVEPVDIQDLQLADAAECATPELVE